MNTLDRLRKFNPLEVRSLRINFCSKENFTKNEKRDIKKYIYIYQNRKLHKQQGWLDGDKGMNYGCDNYYQSNKLRGKKYLRKSLCKYNKSLIEPD